MAIPQNYARLFKPFTCYKSFMMIMIIFVRGKYKVKGTIS